ncbi:hypothetical protein SDJN03_13448, partial [Cucurbita argyrosperma subsp. sororia]
MQGYFRHSAKFKLLPGSVRAVRSLVRRTVASLTAIRRVEISENFEGHLHFRSTYLDLQNLFISWSNLISRI